MIISAQAILSPRKYRFCDVCGEDIGHRPTLRLYGAASTLDKPHVLYCHPSCGWDHQKIEDARQEIRRHQAEAPHA